jgi:iron complex outermembrane receptor protein
MMEVLLLAVLLVAEDQQRSAQGQEPGVQEVQEESVEEPVLEEHVEVQTEAVADDVAAFATHLDTTEIASRGEDLAAVLRRVPSARVRQYGGLGQFATLSLRSSTAEQVAIHLDGIPQNRALGGAVDLSFLPATQLQSLSVYRGFAPAASGSAALGGLVDIRTRTPGEEPEGEVYVLGGELDSRRATGSVAFRAGEHSSHRFSAEWLESQGNFEYLDTRETPFDPTDDVTRERDNNDVEHLFGLWHSNWEVGDSMITARGRVQGRERGVAGVSSRPALSARLEEGLADASLAWSRKRSGALQTVNVMGDGFRQEITFNDPDSEVGPRREQTTTLTGAGVAATLGWWVAPHKLVGRLEMRHEKAEVVDLALAVPDRGGASRDLISASLEDVIPLGNWTLAPSLRGEWRHDTPEAAGDGTLPTSAEEVRQARWSGKLGVSYEINKTCAARGSAGTFFRNPNLVEMFGDRGFIAGNPTLRPESGAGVEAGVACAKAGRWSVETVLFGRRVEDLIQFTPVSLGVAKAMNLAEAEIVGLELAGSFKLPAGFQLEGSATLQQAEDTGEGPAHGKPLVFQPQKLGWISGSWRRSPFTVRYEITYVGENSTDRLDTPVLRLPERIIHDFFFAWDAPGKWRLALDVRNVLDRLTLDVQRYPLPGRVIFLSVGWRWGGAPA